MADPSRHIAQLVTDPESELVFAAVSPVGSDLDQFEALFVDQVKLYGYGTLVHRLSDLVERVHTEHVGAPVIRDGGEHNRINSLMTAGNTLRQISGRGDIMALYAVAEIRKAREATEKKGPIPKTVHLLRSLKHPDEVEALRRVYGAGFFLIGLHATESKRFEYLNSRKGIPRADAEALMSRDRSEVDRLGQQTRDTFTLADVFVQSEADEHAQLARFLDMIFGDPYQTPTADEHAMFLAYGASLRSGQLARQVGAVVVSAAGDVIATGANDVPRFGGGQYFPQDGDQRDHKRGFDANDREIQKIISEIVAGASNVAEKLDSAKFAEFLSSSAINDLTEYGRPVHAEMEALLTCARSGVSTRNGILYTTTFPCHNCAKHIVAAGISKVIYVEPYPKSKAFELHDDSIALDDPTATQRVLFLPFVGITARRYFDLFSMRLGDGLEMKRKKDGKVIPFDRAATKPRVRMSPFSYIERETLATKLLDDVIETMPRKAQPPNRATDARAAVAVPPHT